MKKNSILVLAFLTVLAFGFQAASAQITITIPKFPKIKKPKTEKPRGEQPQQRQSDEEEFNPSQDEIRTNRAAPSDYDANLKVNETAVAVIISSLEPVRIIAKSGGVYKVKTLNPPYVVYYVRANSVYPYFDTQEFGKIVGTIDYDNTQYLAPYLECYAKKHNLELVQVTGYGFVSRRYDDAQKMRQALQAEQAKLAELESMLKSKLQARPNTFLSHRDNPAIWEEITVNRAQYLQCAVAKKESLRFSESGWLQAHLADIAEKQKEVEAYNSDKLYMVSATTYDYLLFAVSPRARDEWLKDANAMDFKPALDAPLAALAAAAAKKLPIYLPGPANFAFRSPLEEQKMKKTLGNIATLKIHKIGLAQSSWLIGKNSIGIPTARYKQGYVWVRETTDDHPYCRLYQINIIQDYAGGGRYGASYAKFLDNTLSGCPAGAK
ncbi:hypothetical protein BH20ACI1_BH20ACI1_04040 [soil metagenome]